jgi:uncharacterized protein
MRETVLGKSGLKVSAVGFGGIPIQRISEAQAIAVIHKALDLGVTFFDTAAGYGDSQRKIGKAIAGRREGLVLATKSPQKTRDGILADVERSRQELGVDHIDLYQLHGVSSPDAWEKVRAPGGALEGLVEAREKGWIGHIGYTSHSADVAMTMVDHDLFETVQFPFNLVTIEPAEKLIPMAREQGLGFIVMKPLCGGQYDNADLAFKFLNAYPDLVPIPGIERTEEIEEIVAIVQSGQTLVGEEKARAEKVAAELGKLFCRRCGYCMPCPQGVPITSAMVYESFVNRLPRERIVGDAARNMAAKIDQCVECGQCEKKCPYELPIMETIRRSRDLALSLVGQ